MRLKITIKWNHTCTRMPHLSESGDALGGYHRVKMEAVIKQGWRDTWRV